MTTSITPSIPRYPVSGKATMRISARWPLAYTLRNGYFHAGTYSSFRRRRHGRALDTSAIPATRLLAYTCTHDQVGNRALGDRPSQYLTGGQLAIKAALTLDLPIPQCFSWAKSGGLQPVSVLCSHPEPELAHSTVAGRKEEFAEHGWAADDIPDPQDPQTFQRCKLNWAEAGSGEHARLHRFYRDLIALRHNEADLADPWLDHLMVDYDEQQRWVVMRRGQLMIACNLGAEPTCVPVSGELVLAWESPIIGDNSTELAAYSLAILRAAEPA